MGRIQQFSCSVSYTLGCSDRNIPKLLLINLIKHKSFLKAYLNSTQPINNQRYPTTECWPIPLSLSIFGVLPRGHPALYVHRIHITVQCWPIHSELGSQTAQNLAGGSTASYRSRSVWVAGCISVYSLQMHNWVVLYKRKNMVTCCALTESLKP